MLCVCACVCNSDSNLWTLILQFPFNQTTTDSWHITPSPPPVLEPLMAFYFPFRSAYSSHSCMDHLKLSSIPPQLWLTASAFAAFFLLRVVTGGGICKKEFNAASSMLVFFAILFPFRFLHPDFILPRYSSQSASKPRSWQEFHKVKLVLFKRSGLAQVCAGPDTHPARYRHFHPFSVFV